MALKKSVTIVDFAKLDKTTQSLYKAEPVDGNHVLDLEGEEDIGALKRAKEREVEENKELRKKLKDIEDAAAVEAEKARKAAEKAARESGDVKALEKSWQDKHAAEQKKLQDQLAQKDAALVELTVGNTATAMAAKISTAPDLILPHISKRLRSEIVDGKAVVKVVDVNGQPSALTVAELEQEFVANKSFAAILTGSKASGGGAQGGGGGGGAPSGGKVDFSKSPKEIAAGLAASGRLKTAGM